MMIKQVFAHNAQIIVVHVPIILQTALLVFLVFMNG